MTVRLSLLAILDQAPCYGYQLRTELDRRTGAGGPINVGQIYNTLDRLERDHLVLKASSGADHQNYFSITDTGRAAVRTWFEASAAQGTLGELASKIALATSLPGVDAARVIRVQRDATERLLESLSPIVHPHTAEDVARATILAGRVESATAELRFLDEVELLLARAGELGVGVMDVATETPRRGRPPKVVSS